MSRISFEELRAALPDGWRVERLASPYVALGPTGERLTALHPLDLVASVHRLLARTAPDVPANDLLPLASCPTCSASQPASELVPGGCSDCTVPDALVADVDRGSWQAVVLREELSRCACVALAGAYAYALASCASCHGAGVLAEEEAEDVPEPPQEPLCRACGGTGEGYGGGCCYACKGAGVERAASDDEEGWS